VAHAIATAAFATTTATTRRRRRRAESNRARRRRRTKHRSTDRDIDRTTMFAACARREKTRERATRDRIDARVDAVVRAMTRADATEEATTSEGRRATADDEPLTHEGEWPRAEGMSLINKAIFQAPASSYGARSHPWSPAHCARVRSGAGYEFPCVWIACKRAPAERVVIHCHANACDIGHIHSLCARDAECWRANVLLVEYPGYGTSEGVAYERAVDRHVAAAYVYVTEECGVNPRDVVVLGRSLGTGPATKLAAAVERLDGAQLGGVILHSPFTSVKQAGLVLLGQIAHIMDDRWDNREWVRAYKARTLIVHAIEDEVVPFAHAQELDEIRRAAGLHCKLHSTHGTHNYFSYYRDYLQPILEFIDSNIKPGIGARKLAPLADPIPRCAFSEAQVRNIMAMVKAQVPNEAEANVPLGLRFYGMVDSVGDTISPVSTSPTKSGFSRFGSSGALSTGSSPPNSGRTSPKTPQKTGKSKSISPTSTIVGDIDPENDADDMILTPGGAKPRLTPLRG
jgi:acetyl esterase/lipase